MYLQIVCLCVCVCVCLCVSVCSCAYDSDTESFHLEPINLSPSLVANRILQLGNAHISYPHVLIYDSLTQTSILC